MSDQDAPHSATAAHDEHWHHTMLQPRVWGLFDIRALLAGLFCFVNLFAWWDIKLTVLAISIIVFTALEARRITPEVALRQILAWVRGPTVPSIATRSHRTLNRRPSRSELCRR